MNRAQKKLARKLQLLLVLPVLIGTAALVSLSTWRQRGVLAQHGGDRGSVTARILDEQALFAALEGLLVVVAIAVAVSWVARQLGRELGAVVEASERIGQKQFDTRVEVRSRLGLERVPQAFNEMAAKLEDAAGALRAADQRAQEFNERLAHAQMLAAVGQVAASIAHEVGSPLNAILVNARLAAEDERCTPSVRASLETIAAQSERIGSILRRMLQLSQPPDERRGECDARAVAKDVVSFLDGLLKKSRVECKLELPASAAPVRMRAEELQQVLFNLVMNGVQAQPSGGLIVLAVRPEGPHVRLEVRDAGAGVSDEDLPRLWEPFFTRRREAGGTGLGLPVVKHLVERSDGTVSVERAPEGGAGFALTLPASVAPSSAA